MVKGKSKNRSEYLGFCKTKENHKTGDITKLPLKQKKQMTYTHQKILQSTWTLLYRQKRVPFSNRVADIENRLVVYTVGEGDGGIN